MRRMKRVHEDEKTLVLVPADPDRPSIGDLIVTLASENDYRDRDAALGQAIRERADNILYGPIPSERSNFDDVGDFHEKFGLGNITHGKVGIVGMPADLLEFRLKFLGEELDEFAKAMDSGNQADAFDALLDLVYVAMGTAHLLGFPWQEGWDLVQAANMTKVRATTGTVGPRGDFKYDVVKPEGWTPPDIEGLLRKYGWPD